MEPRNIKNKAMAYQLLPDQSYCQEAQSSSVGVLKVELEEQQPTTKTQQEASSRAADAEHTPKYDRELDADGRGNRPRLGKRKAENPLGRCRNKMKLPEVFRFFGNIERVKESNAKPGAVSASCNACRSRIKGFVSVTSNFIKHLRVKHAEIYAAFLGLRQAGAPPNILDFDSFDDRVLTYIIDSALPLATVENPSFRNLFKDTSLRVMNSSQLEMRLHARFLQMSSSLKQQLAREKYVCTCAHVWSGRGKSFLGYTCHWLDDKYQRHSVALACRRFTEDCGTVLDAIDRMNNDYGLNNLKIVATVMHNASSSSKAFREFGVLDRSFTEETENDAHLAPMEVTNNTLPCASEALNALASEDFVDLLSAEKTLRDRHLKILAKCSSLWRKCECAKSTGIMDTVLGEPLVRPTVSNWNSVYDAICFILLHKEKLAELCSRLSLHNSCLSAGDLQYLEEYRALMAPIFSTVDFLHLEDNMFYGCLIPALTSLCVKLKRVSDSSQLIDLRSVAVGLQRRLKERFAKYLELAEEANNALIASVLCPSVRMRWFKALARMSSHGRSVEDIHRLIIAEAVRHAKASENVSQSTVDKTHPADKDDFYEFDEIEDACETSDLDMSQPSPLPATTKLSEDAESQLHSYLSDPCTKFEVLAKYPLLLDLALKYNTPLTCSTPLERGLKQVTMNRIWETADNSMEKQIFLKVNCNFSA